MIATKEQERKVLAQIGKIIDGLGENSYVGTAFTGCFDIAADNIENDFGNSLQAKLDNAYAQVARVDNERSALASENKKLKEMLAEASERLQNMAEEHIVEKRQISKKILPPAVLQDTTKLFQEIQKETEAEIIVVSQTMCLNDPAGAVFAKALQRNKVLLGRYNKISAILLDLETFDKQSEEKENEN